MLLDVNALVALAWDSHVHHTAVRDWFDAEARSAWATCPVSESGFVRVSANAHVLPAAIGIADALLVLQALRRLPGHRFLVDDVSISGAEVPRPLGHRQVTDAHLIAVARRHRTALLTFDRGAAALAGGEGARLLVA